MDKFFSLIGALVFLGLFVAGMITATFLPLALSVLLVMLTFNSGLLFLTMLDNLKRHDYFDRRDAQLQWNIKYSLN